jgi:hypothetical protein
MRGLVFKVWGGRDKSWAWGEGKEECRVSGGVRESHVLVASYVL